METLISFLVIGLLLVATGLIIACPIILLILFQNRRRRQYTREIADALGLEFFSNDKARFTRAQPSAKGRVDGFLVTLTTDMSRSTTGSGGHRLDLAKLVVFTYPATPLLLEAKSGTGQNTGSFDDHFLVTPAEASDVLDVNVKNRLEDHRVRFDRTMTLQWTNVGRVSELTSHTTALVNARVREMIEDRLRIMLAMAGANC